MNIVISGGSSTAEHLVRSMAKEHHSITVIEEDAEVFERLSESMPSNVMLVYGDGCDSDVQHDADIDDADLFIALMGHDETNYVACELARIEAGVKRCIAVLNNPRNEVLFRKSHIEPISTTGLIARMVEQEELIGDLRTVLSLREGDIVMVEKNIPKRMRHRNGVRIDEIDIIRQAQLIAVVRDGDFVMINDDVFLMPGERIVAAVKSGFEDDFYDMLKAL